MQRKVSAKNPGENLLESSRADDSSLAKHKESAGEESLLAKFSSFSSESWSAQSQVSSYEEPEGNKPEDKKPEEKKFPRCIII
jgi:hypothetical protein